MNTQSKSLWLLMLVGCGQASAAEEGEPRADGLAANVLPLYSQPDNATWPFHDIPVCWSASAWANPDLDTFREETRTLVENSYGRVTDLRFHGWGRCSGSPARTIRINLGTDAGGYTAPWGYNADSATEIFAGTGGSYDYSHAVIMHEFAHALGFDHEIDRPDHGDSPCLVNAGDIAGTNYTPYDDRSILNSTYCGNYTDLSPWDVVGLQRVYGRKPLLSLVGANNKCADIDNPGAAEPDGASRVQAWECIGNSNQTWALEDASRFHAGPFDYGYLDVEWGDSADGTAVWNWQDAPGEAQTWSLDAVQIVGMGDLCLQVPNDSWFVGQTLELATCDAGAHAQQWYVKQSPRASWHSQVRGLSNGQTFCVGLGASSAALTACDAVAAQDSLWLIDRHLVSETNGCLDVQWGDPTPGNTVWSYQCNWNSDAEAQFWHVRGAIHGLAGKCLDLDASSTIDNGSSVQLWSCNGALQQTWDYHF